MAAFSTLIAVGGLALGAIGAGVQYAGQRAQSRAIRRENRVRQQAAELEARRERRKAVRQMMLARAQSLATGAGQGLGFGSSAFPGALASATTTGQQNVVNTNQNLEIGGRINSAQNAQANAQTLSSLGGGIQSIGGSLYSGSETLGRVSNYYTGRQY